MLSQYRILGKAGAGGMGVVYKALDVKLNRHVALKFLPLELAADPVALERFQREARAIAALDHPNICMIHSIADEGRHPFIVMQWLEGETLKQRIERQPLAAGEVLRIAIQVTDALDKVHAQGIIHRDIKPANIIITTDGQAKILDFGIAKLTPAVTNPGLIVGTLGYMSPEQIQGRELDSRSDLYSWGVVLSEVSSFSSAVPPALDRIIKKALQKEPQHRYQSAAEMRADLVSLVDAGNSRKSLLSTKRLLAAAALLLALTGLIWWRQTWARLDFAPSDAIVIGVIRDNTGDSTLDGTIANALRIALEQSKYFDVLPALLTNESVSSEVCRSAGGKILIDGSIAGANGRYELALGLTDCTTGRTVRRLEQTVDSRAQILPAVDDVARNIRLQLGEPQALVTESRLRLDQATTSSLEALKFYVDGNALFAKGNPAEAVVLLKRAVELDPEFARAYASLGYIYAARDAIVDSREGDRYFQEALKRLDRVSERERLEIRGLYHASIGDEEAALSHYRVLVNLYPKANRYRGNLASSLRRLDRMEEALREYEQLHRLDPKSASVLINIAVCHIDLKQYDQAIADYQKAFALAPERETNLIQNHQYGWLHVMTGRDEEARTVFNKMLNKGAFEKARGQRSLGILALYRGRFSEAKRYLEEASRLHELEGGFNSAVRDLLYLAEALLLVGQKQEGLRQLDRAMALAEKSSFESFVLSWLSTTNSRAGRIAHAQKQIALIKKRPTQGAAADKAYLLHAEAELALAKHPNEEAVEMLRRARSAGDFVFSQLSLATGLARTGETAEAVQLYESILANPAPSGDSQVAWVLAHGHLGRLYEAIGQKDKARAVYEKMLEHWSGADPDLLPVKEVRRRLDRL
jgi:tetratricopeptide (TPR) repeat protein